MFCPQCGKQSDDSAKFCADCGFELAKLDQIIAKEPEDPDAFYKAAIGPHHQDYYLRIFQRFRANGKTGISWHWPAFFFTFFWLMYRKMAGNAIAYFLMSTLTLPITIMVIIIPAGKMIGEKSTLGAIFAGFVYLVIIFVIPAMYANAWYYKRCNRDIATVKSWAVGTQKKLHWISVRGGVGKSELIASIIIFCLFAILVWTASSSKSDYVSRARISEALGTGASAAHSVADYYQQHHQSMPDSLDATGFSEKLPSVVKEMTVDHQSGTVSITLSNVPNIGGKKLLLTPSIDGNNPWIWYCTGQEIPDEYLPRACRHPNGVPPVPLEVGPKAVSSRPASGTEGCPKQ